MNSVVSNWGNSVSQRELGLIWLPKLAGAAMSLMGEEAMAAARANSYHQASIISTCQGENPCFKCLLNEEY